jgi:mono/diheme cytochrome c family protein
MNRAVLFAIVLTAVATVLVLALVLLGIAYSGAINAAATHEHYGGVEWILETTRENSIADRAVPLAQADAPDLDDPSLREAGLRHFHETCATCHGAPGVEPAEFARGLNPDPPNLAHERHDPGHNFWIVQHGLRMTGMPAFGPTHPERDLWAIVAFLDELPDLGPEEYQRRVQRAGLSGSGDDRHEHGHAHGAGHDAGAPEDAHPASR